MSKGIRYWQKYLFRGLIAVTLLLSPSSLLPNRVTGSQLAAPAGLSRPTNVACRPQGGNADTLRVSWKDTNDNAADYKVYRQEVGDDQWDELDTVIDPNDDGDWLLVDVNAANATYRYSVTAVSGSDETVKGEAGETCREPLFIDGAAGNYRVFYRLQECPPYDGKAACTEDITVDGKNKHAVQVAETSEDYRSEFIDLGFDDPAVFNELPYFPLDFFPCNNGCSNGDGIQYPPSKFEGADYDPVTATGSDYEVFVAGHEIFHKVQGVHGGGGADPYYKWLIEGQARASEDKSCIFTPSQCLDWDTKVDKYWLGQVTSYLGAPEQALLDASYNAALFWAYVMEQFSTTKTEPEYGMDVLLQYWQQNRENINNDPDHKGKDGIDTLNDTLDLKIGSDRRFEDLFEDFAVANYAKDILTNPASADLKKYNYVDEEQCPTCNYGSVKRTISETLNVGDSIFGTSGMDAWGTRYFQVKLDSSVPAVHIEVEPLAVTPHELYYHVLGIKNNTLVDQWSGEGTSFDLTVSTIDPIYDRLALIVVSHEHKVNFEYGFNLMDGIFIKSPTNQFPAKVGEAAAPRKFILQLSVLDEEQNPVTGIDTSQFTITIGSKVVNPPANPADNAIVATTYVGNQYWISLRAPSDAGCTNCDLTVQYASYSDSEAAAVRYGPVPDVDNQIIIDRSGSMAGEKIVSAKDAAKLYVDSYNPGDHIGVVSFNDAPHTEYPLTGWTDDTRLQAQNAIADMDDPDGATAIGAALRSGMQLLVDQADPNPAWAIVLLSDGVDTVEEPNDHIPAFLDEYDTRKKTCVDKCDTDKKVYAQVPVINSIAVGDDADGVALEKVAQISGGQLQWLPDPSGLMAASTDAPSAIPLQLELAEIYRVFAETVLGEQQVYAANDVINNAQTKNHLVQVDGGASEAIFSVAFQYIEIGIPITIKIFRPDNTQIGPPTLGSARHFFWRVPAPQAGQWRVEVSPIIPGVAAATAEPSAPSAAQTNFLVEAAVQSELSMSVFLGLAPDERIAGKPMPLVVLLADVAAITGATVKATVERTGEILTLFDDGAHGDGASADGFYGGLIKNTHQPGGYTVIVDADGTSPLLGAFDRRARVSFFMADTPDGDNDGLPDWWENEHPCMKPTQADRADDPDNDGLNNAAEFGRQTNPCDPDTDDGGEGDGSEVQRGADPLVPTDDGIRPPQSRPWPGVSKVILYLSAPPTATSVEILRGPAPEGPFTVLVADLPPTVNPYEDTTVTNGTRYCYQVVAKIATAGGGANASAPSEVTCVTPNLDPHQPHGIIEPRTPVSEPAPRTLLLHLDASDDPQQEEHMPFDGALLTRAAQQSGVVGMRISNRSDFADTTWEPYQAEKEWTFAPDANGQGSVFVQYKDAAGNLSDVVALTLQISEEAQPTQSVFLPLIRR